MTLLQRTGFAGLAVTASVLTLFPLAGALCAATPGCEMEKSASMPMNHCAPGMTALEECCPDPGAQPFELRTPRGSGAAELPATGRAAVALTRSVSRSGGRAPDAAAHGPPLYELHSSFLT